MQKKEVLLVLTDRWADWEAGYAIAQINAAPQYTVKTIAVDREPKASIGGMRAEIDCTIHSYTTFENLAMVILPGGYAWQEAPHQEIAAFVRKAQSYRVPVAAICGATIFLGKHGFLDQSRHTGDELAYFENEEGYGGRAHYVPAQVVVDNGFITANETAAVAFAYEICKTLAVDTPEERKEWFELFHNGMVR